MPVSELEQRLSLLSSWEGQIPAVLIANLVEAAVFSEERYSCDWVFDALPPKHAEEARRHALCMLRRLEQGLRKSHLLEALVRSWPLEVLGLIPELATDEEKAQVIQQLVTHEPLWESDFDADRDVLLRLARELKNPAWRGRALQSLMSGVPDDLPELRSELGRELLAATRELRPDERAAVLGVATRQLPETLVPEALELLRDAPRGESWFRAHEGLVPYLSAQQLDQLLGEAERVSSEVLRAVCDPEFRKVREELGISINHVESGCLRTMVLLALIDRYPGRHREWLVDRTLAVMEEPWTSTVKARALAGLVRRLGAFSPRMERIATGLLVDHSTSSQVLETLGPLLTPSLMQSLLESLVGATPHVKAAVFGALARTVSGERRLELVQLLQRVPLSVRAWGVAAMAPRLTKTPDDALLSPVWEELQLNRDEHELSGLSSFLISAAPADWVPELFHRVARKEFTRTEWFVSFAVAASRRAPVLIEQAIQAAGAHEDPWKHFEVLALRISELPLDECLRGMRTLWMEVQRTKKPGDASFIEFIQFLAEFGSMTEETAGPYLASGDIDETAIPGRALEILREKLPRAAVLVRDRGPRVVIGSREELDVTQVLSLPESDPLSSTKAKTLLAIGDFERSLPPAEPVLLGTSAPVKVSPGDEFTARFVACVERLEREVAAKLELLGPGANTVIGFQRCQWQLGSRFRVRVTSPHLILSPEEQEFVWNADSSVLDFGVRVPPKARGLRTSLQFEVFLDTARVALLRHDLSVAFWRRKAGKRRVRLRRAPRTAFASFASTDRNRVLDRIASLRLAAGLDVFMDCLSLRPGEKWKQALRTEIKQRELFLLFWSQSAQASQWVEWEWRTALRVKKLEAIQPHPLDPVSVAPPPKELAMLHFGDIYMQVRRE